DDDKGMVVICRSEVRSIILGFFFFKTKAGKQISPGFGGLGMWIKDRYLHKVCPPEVVIAAIE
ncbi:hypothetical protein, partial [Escherichia coli]|uniref:hypothetical protein n=1 Tax=Escherichia coli TaxID=562 RepID=UPI002B24857E